MGASRELFICRARRKIISSPEPPNEHADLVYLCFPNNPTGAVASREQLTRWVEYAREHEALLLFDAAYEGYISDPADSAFHLRNSRRARMCRRVSQFFQDRRIHRRALRIHRHVEIAASRDTESGKENAASSALASALEHESQRRELSRCNAAPRRFTATKAARRFAR